MRFGLSGVNPYSPLHDPPPRIAHRAVFALKPGSQVEMELSSQENVLQRVFKTQQQDVAVLVNGELIGEHTLIGREWTKLTFPVPERLRDRCPGVMFVEIDSTYEYSGKDYGGSDPRPISLGLRHLATAGEP